jgi:RNA polymerase sigma-70 factor (ECF subfamily)
MDSMPDPPDPSEGSSREPGVVAKTVELVRRVHAGDEAAREELFTRYYPRVLGAVRRRLGPRLRSKVEVEDVVQDSFCRMLRQLPSFRISGENCFTHWVTQVVIREIYALAERFDTEKRNPQRELPLDPRSSDDSSDESHEPADTSLEPGLKALRAERIDLLQEEMEKLSEQQRELILCRVAEGGSWAEIAHWTGLQNAGAARMQYVRAVVQLNRLLRRRSLDSRDG